MRDIDDQYMTQYASPRVGEQSASVVQIESGKLVHAALILAFMSLLVGALGLGLAVGARDAANRAEEVARHQQEELDRKLDRDKKLIQVEMDSFVRALSRANIPVHADTDKP